MEVWSHDLAEFLRAVAAVISATLAFLPFWGSYKATRAERAVLASLVALAVVLVWPAEFDGCRNRGWYFAGALFLAALAFVANQTEGALYRRYSHSQHRRVDGLVSASTILGGPVLTREAGINSARWRLELPGS